MFARPLTPTNAPEIAAPGSGRGGVGGGAPLRYGYTAPGNHSFTVWADSRYSNGMTLIILGSNPSSNLQVVSQLNLLNLGHSTYWFDEKYEIKKYAPKVYIGTSQTIATNWISDSQNTSKPPANQWPQNFGQTSQKGEDKKLSVALLFLVQIIL